MGFVFKQTKAIQCLGVILDRKSPMDHMEAVKTLYVADRQALTENAYPITGDKYYALHDGPILDQIFKWIKGEDRPPNWNYFFVDNGYQIWSRGKTDVDKLSRFEEKILKFTLPNTDLPEWEKNRPAPGGINPIALRDLVDALNIPQDMKEDILEEETYEYEIEKILSRK